MPGHRLLDGTDLEIACNLQRDDLVLRVNKGGVLVFGALLRKFAGFQKANAAAYDKHNGKFLVRGGQYEARAGTLRPRHIVLEFDSYAAARASHDSPEFQAAAKIRDQACDIDVVIVEGYGN